MALQGVSALQFLDADPEPTFVVDLELDGAFTFVWSNSALGRDPGLRDAIVSANQKSARFWQWIRGSGVVPLFDFSTKTWTTFVYDGRWAIVRGQTRSLELVEGYANTKSQQPAYFQGVEQVTGDTMPLLSPGDDERLASISPAAKGVRIENFHRMMELSNVGVFEYNPNGRLMHANESWYELSGYPRDLEKHVDFAFMDLVYPDDASLVMGKWESLTQGIPVTFDMRWKASQNNRYRDGPDVDAQWVLCACFPNMSPSGDLVSIAGNTVDISAQKRSVYEANQRSEALERARASETKFASFAALAPIAIYFFSPEMVCQYCNSQFFEMTGHPRTDPEKVDWTRIIVEADVPSVYEALSQLIENKKPIALQVRLKRKWRGADGIDRVVWAQGNSYPELNEDGSVKSIGGTLIDISQIKFGESFQKLQVEEALEAKRQQENFIDMTSHEMRNPLSAVVQCADSIVASLLEMLNAVAQLEDPEVEEVEQIRREIHNSLDAVQTIISCSTHQKRIIDDVLTLSKLDSKLVLITPVRVEPVGVITDTIKMFEVECSKLDIELVFDKQESMHSLNIDWVMVDPSRLVQVLINLLTNAIKFTQTQPVRKITVKLGASVEPPPHTWPKISFIGPPLSQDGILDAPDWGDGAKIHLWISVEDTGCGLTLQQQQSLFARFSQATPRTHVRYGGSGLGLFISKSLVEKQGGGIGVHSQEGVGSTFAFFVGARLASRPTPGILIDELTSPVGELSIQDKVKVAHHSVLIVEDNLVNQKVLAKQLVKAGCSVHIADHGRAALSFLEMTSCWKGQETSEIDLSIILMDIEMPVMGGLECAREIRRLQESGQIVSNIPILAVSANARSEQVAEALEAGMDDAITKPFRIADLLPKLERLARGRKKPDS